jgi:tRNA A37 threonylcarbamoyladenosine dehydratase
MKIPAWQERTALLLGSEALIKLASAHVLVVGLGGVGAYAAEMLCRAGVGSLTIVDGDKVQASNRNRQLIAVQSTEGMYKTDLVEARLLDINPEIQITKITEFVKDEKVDKMLETAYDYVIDAIDTLSPKVFLITKTLGKGYPLVSSMGSGGKLDPGLVEIKDISKSYNCKLAYSLRKQLHRLGIRKGFKVVFSSEQVNKSAVQLIENEQNKKSTVGTISYMPPVFGMMLASVVIREIIAWKLKQPAS